MMDDGTSKQGVLTEQDVIQLQLQQLIEDPCEKTSILPGHPLKEPLPMASHGQQESYQYNQYRSMMEKKNNDNSGNNDNRNTSIDMPTITIIQFHPKPMKYVLSCEIEKLLNIQSGSLSLLDHIPHRTISKEDQITLQRNGVLMDSDLKNPIRLLDADYALKLLPQQKSFTHRILTFHPKPRIAEATEIRSANKSSTTPSSTLPTSLASTLMPIKSESIVTHSRPTPSISQPTIADKNIKIEPAETSRMMDKSRYGKAQGTTSTLSEVQPIGRFTALLLEPLECEEKGSLPNPPSNNVPRESEMAKNDINISCSTHDKTGTLTPSMEADSLKRKQHFHEMNDKLFRDKESQYYVISKRDAERASGLRRFLQQNIKMQMQADEHNLSRTPSRFMLNSRNAYLSSNLIL